MPRRVILAVCCIFALLQSAAAQSIAVYQTTPDLLEALAQLHALRFSPKPDPTDASPQITVDDSQRFQEIDGFGASLTDSAAWLISHKLSPAQTDAAFKSLFSRRDGIALSFLRQPIGSSDLATKFYSYDDLCDQTDKACTMPAGQAGHADPDLAHYSLAHDKEYILSLIHISPAGPTGKVHGHVTNPTGEPQANGTVGLSTDGGATQKFTYPVGPDGNYAGDAAPGTYSAVYRAPDTPVSYTHLQRLRQSPRALPA